MDRSQYGRRDRMMQEKVHDAYWNRGKWPVPTVCTECEAVFSSGRWTWQEVPENAHKAVCPACRRIADNYPAGNLRIKGPFFTKNRGELLNLIRNIESQEKSAHPLERIMAIVDESEHTTITTTGIHVARRIGEALSKAYQGDFEFSYGDGDKSIRAIWSR